MTTTEAVAAAEIVYSARPRLIGPGSRFSLSDDALEWQIGARSGRLLLDDVTSVRLTFHPGQLAAPNYEMRLGGRDGTRLRIGSLSRTSLTGIEDNRAAYAAFVRAVHDRLARRGPVAYAAGLPRWRWLLMTALAAITALGLVAVMASTAAHAQWTVLAVLLLLCPLLGWPLVETLWRNVPADYRPPALPLRLVPAPAMPAAR